MELPETRKTGHIERLNLEYRKILITLRFFLTPTGIIGILDFRAETPDSSSRKNLMTMPIPLPAPSTAERYRRLSVDALRQRALERLYERRCALQTLIEALEEYERSREVRQAQCVDFSVFALKCSSGSVQSQI